MDWQDFGQQQDRSFDQGGPLTSGADWVERIMAAEYNLDVQRGDYRNATNTLAKLFGFVLQNLRG